MAFQSLYRRYRPRRFAELLGQDHVVRALRNSVRDGNVGHAYLFSGPRGTGKTSTARILAKALNCDAPVGGEPCCVCPPCVAVEEGNSLSVFELDAASNNGVEAMRELIGRVSLASPGKCKVYIVDEVHMLTTGASNGLLKTLEDPPDHVRFVLATTDPQKLLSTITSRTQHFEFHLLPATVLADHLRAVSAHAGLGADDDMIEQAVRRGKGSARDALSALDQLVALGGATDEDASVDEITEGLCERDTGRALAGVAMACNAGRDARYLADALIAHLRDALLSVLAPDLVSLPDEARERVTDQGRRLGPASTVRALDLLGEAVLAMREAPDPRVALEVGLVRATRPELDNTTAALVERVERLEREQRTARRGELTDPAPPTAPQTATPISHDRPALGALGRRPSLAIPPAADADAQAEDGAEPALPVPSELPAEELPSREELTLAWADHIVAGLRGMAKALYGAGRFAAVENGAAVFSLPTEIMREKAEAMRTDVESAVSAHFHRRIPLRLVVDVPAVVLSPSLDATGEAVDTSDLRDAPANTRTELDLLTQIFPGAEVVDE